MLSKKLKGFALSLPPDRFSLLRSILNFEPFDTILCNLNMVNVFSSEVEWGNIGIKDGKIAYLSPENIPDAQETIDCSGLYAIPGFIDTHVHIDSTLLTPEGLADLVVPHGTTAVFADPMEISNVAGFSGLEAFYSHARFLPYHLFLEVPSRVPTAPGLETTGGCLELKEVETILHWPSSISLGELDPSKVLGLHEEYLKKIDAAMALGKVVNGHTSGLTEDELRVYTCAGIMDDHECIEYSEAITRLKKGLSILIREGSTERNLTALVNGIIKNNTDTRFWMMCTDDKHPNEILREGHIDYMVNKAISLGLDPLKAIQMATINASIHFRKEHILGSLAPGRWADIILSSRLDRIIPEKVLFKGKLVAENGHLISSLDSVLSYPDWLFKTVNITRGTKSQDYFLPCHKGPAHLRVIRILPDQIVNHSESAFFDVTNNNNILPDTNRDLLKLAVVERYGKNGNIGLSFVHGFGIKQGAISSTVSHDHHNLVIVGADEESMATCARYTQEMQGGLVAAIGKEVIASLPLPFGGLMSLEPSHSVIDRLDYLNLITRQMGCVLPAPFMSLSFISLPTVPELGLTDMGLIDVKSQKVISPFWDE